MSKLWSRGSLAVLAVVGAAAAGSGVAIAEVTSHDEIRGCISVAGVLRVVDGDSGCLKRETPVSWNKQGPMGERGPAGVQGPVGPQGEPGAKGEPGPSMVWHAGA